MDARITAVTLGVADVAQSVAFYERLGLKAHTVMDDVAFLAMNGAVLCLYSGLAQDAGVVSQRREIGLAAIAQNVREKDEVDAVLKEAKAAGASITRPAHDADWGGRSGYFTDPDGHLWEIAWNPFWPLDAEGRVTLPAK
jgi:catechol 2,3-dioxygenase-like lactoylglutathione lyase family enzyme